MISPKEAVALVAEKYSNRKPTGIYDYDETHYIVSAPIQNGGKDRNGSFFGVNKVTGNVTGFAPGANYDKFFDAIDNKGIKI